MSLYRDQAIVLRSWKLGEADRILSLHTHNNGKVRGVARGIRRTKSKFGSRLEPLSHVGVQLYRGRGELDTITQVETLTRFSSLRGDPQRLAHAQALLEAVDGVAQDRETDRVLHVMLVKALVTLNQCQSEILVSAFFLKLLAHEGLAPQLDVCSRCGARDSLVAIDEGGVFCANCRRGRALSVESLAVMRRILGGQLSSVLATETSLLRRDVQKELQAVSADLLERHLERRLRSVAVIEQTTH